MDAGGLSPVSGAEHLPDKGERTRGGSLRGSHTQHQSQLVTISARPGPDRVLLTHARLLRPARRLGSPLSAPAARRGPLRLAPPAPSHRSNGPGLTHRPRSAPARAPHLCARRWMATRDADQAGRQFSDAVQAARRLGQAIRTYRRIARAEYRARRHESRRRTAHPAWRPLRLRRSPRHDSCTDDGHVVGVGCQRPEITGIASEDRSAGLGHGDDQGIDGRSPLRRGAQRAGSASEMVGEVLGDIAGLQEPVCDSVVLRPAAEALDEDHGRNHGRPDALASEDHYQRSGILTASGQSGNASRIQDQSRHDARLASSGRRACRAAASALATAARSGGPTSATSSST